MKRLLLLMAPVLAMSTPMLSSCGGTSTPPQPYGATPSPQQVEWQKMEYYMFAHFGPNTFTDMEWGLGNEDPRVFAPTDLDCRQWAQIARDAGMKGIIVTAKHHDGFCLWPSAQSKHTVRESGWRDGKGDVLRELADACREYGLRFGVYVSPWDRNHPAYGTPEYNKVFAETLREVLTNYGDVFEQWLDGANGEGPTGRTQPYDWNLFHNAIYESAPQVIVFSDIGPDARWVGNERGFAGETNWSRLNVTGFTPGLGAPHRDTLNQGNVHGERWLPAEADVSIRPGWFWSAKTNDKVKSVDDLMKIWYGSVGRNANLLLNVPPDRTGRVHPADSARLMEFRVARESAFAKDLAAGATVSASSTRGKNFAATLLTDNDYETWWAAAEKSKTADLTVDLGAPTAFNSVAVQEYIPMGQRVAGFNLSWFDEAAGEWKPLAKGTTIGYKRILNFERVTAQKLKLTIASSLAAPVLSSISIYDSPTL